MRIPDERLGGHRKSEEKEPVVLEHRLHFCHRLQVLVCEALSYQCVRPETTNETLSY
jgi:hypothetical protein